MRAVVTGATGFIGRHLVGRLDRPVILSRRAGERADGDSPARHVWQPEAGPPAADAFVGADVVFSLAGEPIAAGRWTEARKRHIRDSRVVGTRNLVAGLAALARRPSVLVSASAIGYYGDRGDEELDEQSVAGGDFLAGVCAAWEREAMAAEPLGIRVVCVRIGVVLAREGGALPKMLTPFKLGLGGRLGGGAQWMSWVHIDDVVGLMLHAAATGSLRGPLNAVSPEPATNADFTRALGRALHRPAIIPVPAAALRLLLGEMSDLLLGSQRVLPRAAESSGYAFKHPNLGPALDEIMTATTPPARR